MRPTPITLRLGDASTLSVWGWLGSGPAASDRGDWDPGEANDGASAGGVEPG